MAHCRLDHLPVELIHHLLNYFSAHEILHTFTDVSSYIDNVLLTYSNYYVNFKSVTRKEFEFVCQRIQPNQVASLTLSDDEQTPGQVERFLSRFRIDQFTRLRALTLAQVGSNYWEAIVTKLIDLKNLRSFIYDSSSGNDTSVSKLSFSEVVELDKRLFESYAPVLSQLNRLRLSHGDFLSSVQLPHLRHLILLKCKTSIIKHISRAAPQLKSLEMELQSDQSTIEFLDSFDQLNRLVLRITGVAISLNQMEELMAKLPRLKHLELCGHGDDDLLDGQRWQMLTSSLDTFNFHFNLLGDTDVDNLDAFRSPFWLTEKRWYVAYISYGRLFSVPHFVSTETDGNFQLPDLWTVPDISTFYDCITKLSLSETSYDITHRFSEVQTLSMSKSLHLSIIEQIVDLNRIRCLILSSITSYIELIILINEMPHLSRISILDNIEHFLQDIAGGSFEQIRHLDIGRSYPYRNTSDDNTNYDIEQLCSIFPCINRLNIFYRCSETQILHFIEQFKQLTVASFRYNSLAYLDDAEPTDIESALNHHRSVRKLDYSYRLKASSLYVWL